VEKLNGMILKEKRKQMVDALVQYNYISQKKVIDAMLKVERHKFVPKEYIHDAYEDTPLPTEYNQTISAPGIVGIMTELLDVQENDKILEVGAGSGYQAAILAEIAKKGRIYTIERIPELAEKAKQRLKNYNNIIIITGDGTLGYEKEKPYDKIIVTAAAPRIPKALVDQLKEGGRMVIPMGGRYDWQNLFIVEKHKGKIETKKSIGCIFVPLIGEDGWK